MDINKKMTNGIFTMKTDITDSRQSCNLMESLMNPRLYTIV